LKYNAHNFQYCVRSVCTSHGCRCGLRGRVFRVRRCDANDSLVLNLIHNRIKNISNYSYMKYFFNEKEKNQQSLQLELLREWHELLMQLNYKRLSSDQFSER
jgi:hypothetical protein